MATAGKGDLAVRCRGITKSYGTGDAKVTALRGVDLDIRLGELLMLVGPSGCGKTTLISVLAAILDQDDGECTVLGQDVRRLGARARARFRGQTIGFVFQQFNLLPRTSALDNVELPLLYAGVPAAERHARAREKLAQVGLEGRGGHHPSQLSGGQQQRVAIARALVNDPRLILADEPTGALDTATSVEVMALLQALNREGITIVVVTHENDIAAFAGRTILFRDGRVVSDVRQAPRAAAPAAAPPPAPGPRDDGRTAWRRRSP